MDYFLALLVNGLLSGPVYAVVGVAFVVVYRASSILNFSLGEWVSLGARLTGVSVQATGLPLIAGVAAAMAALAGLAALFNRVVVRRLVSRPVIAVIMATLALAVLMRASASLALAGFPAVIPFPFAYDVIWAGDIPIPPARLTASAAAALAVLAAFFFFRFTRAGLAIRAVADDPGAAAAVGISPVRCLTLAWSLSGALAVIGGVLWSVDGLGGFGMGLVLAKVLPVVVIGGLTSLGGVLVGALIVGLAESFAAGYLDPWIGTGSTNLIAASLVLLTLWIRPAGLFGRTRVERV